MQTPNPVELLNKPKKRNIIQQDANGLLNFSKKRNTAILPLISQTMTLNIILKLNHF